MANLDLSDSDRLGEFLTARGFGFIRRIRTSHSVPGGLALFISADAIATRADSRHTSWRQLRQLQNDIQKVFNITVEWILIPGADSADVEAALHEEFRVQFPGVFDSVFVSSPRVSPSWVWLELAQQVKEKPRQDAIEKIVFSLFAAKGFELPRVEFANVEDLPSKATILRAVKIRSPIRIEDLYERLSERGATMPDVRWLQTKLDTLRKAGFLVRSGEGSYAPTELGLASVPSSKNRSSSDIERALALGRLKW